LLSVLALFFWLRKALGTATALATVICFVSSYMALRYFRSAETDAILLFFVIAACIVVYQLLFEGISTSRVIALYVLMGFGFLTKGPAALAMPLAVLLFFSLKRRQYAVLRKLINPLGLSLLLVLALGWYVAIYLKLPDLATYWVSEEVDATYLGGRRPNPVYWYIPGLFKFFAPWSVFFIPAGIWLYRTRPLPPAVQLALVWFAATFIILSLNITKQIQYALLLSPSLAILLGYYLANAQGRYERLNNILYAGLIACGVGAAIWLIVKGEGGSNAQELLLLVIGTLAPVAAAVLLRVNLRRHAPALLLVGLIASVWVYGQERVYADSEESNVKRFALAVKSYDPLYVYGGANARISFYAQRVVPHTPDAPGLGRVAKSRAMFYLAMDSQAGIPDACRNAAVVVQDGQYTLVRCGMPD
ncbi:MAG TPA: glycosyltransferase family 39 protein, partial [Burkholderiales bacterium]